MKNAITITMFLILAVIFSDCKKDDNEYMGKGVITGFDQRDCACCGGLLINLNSASTALYSDSTYQVDQVPDNFYIDTDTGFPVFIKLDYYRNTKKCGKTIDILKFEIE
jgi:hypothetical protein